MRISTARVFFDAFAECLVNASCARMAPNTTDAFRALAVQAISVRHGEIHADNVGKMFDRLMADMQNPGAKR